MPPTILGDTDSMPANPFRGGRDRERYDYNYPRELDLDPGSDFHEELRRRIWEKVWDSKRYMSNRYSDWREIDKTLKAYVPVERNALRDRSKEDPDPLERIVMPVTFANLETLLTYMSSAFLQDPIFHYEGVGPEDVYGGYLMTQVISQQTHRFKAGLALHTQWRDAFAYGAGVTAVTWEKKYGKVVSAEEEGFMSTLKNLFVVTDRKKKVKDGVLFEGNKLFPIDPYKMFPDPQVGIHEIEDAEFFSWVDETTFLKLLAEEKRDKDIFNVRYLKRMKRRSTLILGVDERENSLTQQRMGSSSNHPVDVLVAYINLIPQDWKLGRGKYPEVWQFMLAADQVIISAKPLGLHHGRIPVVAAAPDYDGHSGVSTSRLMVTMDLQRIIDFLYSSHIANIRKAINDMIVVDPSMINIHDLNNPKPGKLIRTRRSTWGRGGIDSAIKQLGIVDITQGHVNDASFLMGFMENVLGTSANLKGEVVRSGERVSATESRDARMSGLSRIERLAKIIAMQSMEDIAYIMASHTQQFMEEETYIKASGEWAERLKNDYGVEADSERILVDPLDLLIDYDLKEVAGTIPGSEDPSAWIQVLQMAAQSPELAAHLNMPRLVQHIARHLGAKNVDDFVNRAPQAAPQVMEDEEVMRQLEAGNVAPAGDGQAGSPPVL